MKRTVKAFAQISRKSGNIRYFRDTFYSAQIDSHDSKFIKYRGYKIVPVVITYEI